MRRLSLVLMVAMLAGTLAAAPATAAGTPVGDWALKGTLVNSLGSPPSLTKLGATQWVTKQVNGKSRKVLAFDPAEGLTMSGIPSAVRANYTIEVLIQAADFDGYWRVLSFGPNDRDDGLYIYGYINGENTVYLYDSVETKNVPAVQNGMWLRVRVTRSSATNVMKVYVNGKQVIQWADTDGLYKLREGTMVFFQDDGSEDGSGWIAGMRLWRGVVAP